MEIKRIDHYSIRTLDVEATRKFYTEIVGGAERTVPTLDLHQVFIKDPNGLTIVLHFPAFEAPQVQSATTTVTA